MKSFCIKDTYIHVYTCTYCFSSRMNVQWMVHTVNCTHYTYSAHNTPVLSLQLRPDTVDIVSLFCFLSLRLGVLLDISQEPLVEVESRPWVFAPYLATRWRSNTGLTKRIRVKIFPFTNSIRIWIKINCRTEYYLKLSPLWNQSEIFSMLIQSFLKFECDIELTESSHMWWLTMN